MNERTKQFATLVQAHIEGGKTEFLLRFAQNRKPFIEGLGRQLEQFLRNQCASGAQIDDVDATRDEIVAEVVLYLERELSVLNN